MKEYLKSLLALYERKNAAYGNSTHITYCRYGKEAYIVRLTDKLNRLETLMENSFIDQNDESILDTLDDAINYFIIFAGDMIHGSNDPLDEGNVDKTIELFRFLIDRYEGYHDLDVDLFFGECMNYSTETCLSDVLYEMYTNDAIDANYMMLFASYLIDVRLKYERRNNA